MTRTIRSRRLGLSPEEARLRPLYARLLGLRYLNPGGMLCFVYFEGTIALGVLLALAELVTWWGVLILPASVAVMVKVNDMVAGAVVRSAARTPERERARALLREPASQDRASRGGAAAAPLDGAVAASLGGAEAAPGGEPAWREPEHPRDDVGRPRPVVGRAAVVGGYAAPVREPVLHPLNSHPAEQAGHRGARQWADRVDFADAPAQRARQSASRRYD